MCDRPSIRLGPGEMVWARVNVHDLDPNLEPGEYPFAAVFGAVGSVQEEPAPPAIGWYFEQPFAPILEDKLIRDAIEWLINEAEVSGDFFFFPNWPSLEGAVQGWDPDRATELLAAAGFGGRVRRLLYRAKQG